MTNSDPDDVSGGSTAMPVASEFVTRHGTIAAFPIDHPIATALARYGEWAEAEIETLVQLVAPGNVVLDVGAHVGIFTLAFAHKLQPSGKVISFEPQPALFDLMKQNVDRNHLSRIVDARNMAVGSVSGHASISPIDYSRPGNFGGVITELHTGSQIEPGRVSVQRIDDLHLAECRLIKIDVEGNELHVIEGAQETIRRTHPIVSAEAHSVAAAWERARALWDLDLRTWLLATPAFNPVNLRGDPEDMFDLAYECAVIGAAEKDGPLVQVAARLGARITPFDNIDQLAHAFLEVPLPSDTNFERASARANLRRIHQERAEALRSVEREAKERRRVQEALATSRVDLELAHAETQRLFCDLKDARGRFLRAEQERLAAIRESNEQRVAQLRAEVERTTAELQTKQSELNETRQTINRLHEVLADSRQESQLRLRLARDLAHTAGALSARPFNNLKKHLIYRLLRLVKRSRVPLPHRWSRRLERIVLKRHPKRFGRLLDGLEAGPKSHTSSLPDVASAHLQSAVNPDKRQFEDVMINVAASGTFDSAWYLARYPDIESAGIDPLKHYVFTGWRELRDPNSWFSTSYYLTANPDVAAAGINPLWHYTVAGKKEGRQFAHPGGSGAEILSKLIPLSEQRRLRRAHPDSELNRLDEETLAQFLKTGASGNRLLIALSHDDYRRVSGGIQLCIQIEHEAALAVCGGAYLNLHPRISLPSLVATDKRSSYELVAVINGQALGFCSAEIVLSALQRLGPEVDISVIVHSLLGHSPEFVGKLCKDLLVSNAMFWLHDYFAACSGYSLMRNSVKYCSAPPVGSAACQICIHGDERRIHYERMHTLFENIRFQFIAPSEAAKRTWIAATGDRGQIIEVIPHCVIGERSSGAPKAAPSLISPIRIAFLGYSKHHKGWNVFLELAKRFRDDSRYKFLHLGSENQSVENIEFEDVSITRDGRDAMIQAVKRCDVDIALTWSLWPETFGFVGYEAVAGGAKILTCDGAGHLSDLARMPDCGLVFPDEQALHEAFRSDTIFNLASSRRASGITGYKLIFSRMSVELLTQSARSEFVA